MSSLLFYSLASVILLSALAVVTGSNLFHSGLFLIVTFLGIAGLYVSLWSPFLGGIQVLVYAGAIAVILLFAFMLTHNIMGKQQLNTLSLKFASFLLCLSLGGAFTKAILSSFNWNKENAQPGTGFALKDIGEHFMTHSIVPFELISLLLLITLIGAIVIARKEERDPS